MSEHEEQLRSIRDHLDDLDERLVGLISERASLAQSIGETKAAAGLRVYAPDREREVLDRVCGFNRGPIDDRALRSVYRELMSASLSLERSPRIAILGPKGSYSHLAARRKFGMSVEFETVSSIAAVFAEVAHGHAEYGLAPVENSIGGGIGETLDALVDHDLTICGEVNLAVHHHLLATCRLEEVEKVYSKPEVFAQCQTWLAETGLLGKIEPASSTSAAAQRVQGEPNSAAIASELAAELFDLQRVAEFVEDDAGNVTRFLIIGTSKPKPTGSDKTSVVFSVGHKPGMLVDALGIFRDAGINMTRIESRPNRHKRWEYYFFIDLEGHRESPPMVKTLTTIAPRCHFWKILGSYPTAVEVV